MKETMEATITNIQENTGAIWAFRIAVGDLEDFVQAIPAQDIVKVCDQHLDQINARSPLAYIASVRSSAEYLSLAKRERENVCIESRRAVHSHYCKQKNLKPGAALKIHDRSDEPVLVSVAGERNIFAS